MSLGTANQREKWLIHYCTLSCFLLCLTNYSLATTHGDIPQWIKLCRYMQMHAQESGEKLHNPNHESFSPREQ